MRQFFLPLLPGRAAKIGRSIPRANSGRQESIKNSRDRLPLMIFDLSTPMPGAAAVHDRQEARDESAPRIVAVHLIGMFTVSAVAT